MAHLKIGKADKGRYTISFDTDNGTVTCEVSPLPNPPEGSAADEKEAALKRAKRMVHAFYEAIPDA